MRAPLLDQPELDQHVPINTEHTPLTSPASTSSAFPEHITPVDYMRTTLNSGDMQKLLQGPSVGVITSY